MKLEMPKDRYEWTILLLFLFSVFWFLHMFFFCHFEGFLASHGFLFYSLTKVLVFLFSIAVLLLAFVEFRASQSSHEESRNHLLQPLMTVFIVIFFISFFSTLGFDLCSATPEVCIMPSGVNCQKAYIGADSHLIITLVNGLGKPIVVTSIACTQNPNYYGEPLAVPVTIAHEATGTFKMPCTNLENQPYKLQAGEMYSGKINMEYYFQDEGPDTKRHLTGTLTVRAGR